VNFEIQVRRLASLEERIATLTTQKETLRDRIGAEMGTENLKKVETLYGYVQVKEQEVFDFSQFPEVAAAALELRRVTELAKAKVKAAELAAIEAKAPSTTKKTFAFYRNKAVSARAQKGRVYVATIHNPNKRALAAQSN
jgi:hypothetical protein